MDIFCLGICIKKRKIITFTEDFDCLASKIEIQTNHVFL